MPHLGTPSCSLRGPPHPHSLSSGPCTGAPVPLQRAPPCNYAPISIPEGPGFPGDLRPHGNSGDLTRCWAYTPGEVTGRCQGNGRRAGPERGVMWGGGKRCGVSCGSRLAGLGRRGGAGVAIPPRAAPGWTRPAGAGRGKQATPTIKPRPLKVTPLMPLLRRRAAPARRAAVWGRRRQRGQPAAG